MYFSFTVNYFFLDLNFTVNFSPDFDLTVNFPPRFCLYREFSPQISTLPLIFSPSEFDFTINFFPIRIWLYR